MKRDIIDWNRIKKLIVDIAEIDGEVMLFDGDKAIKFGYTELEQVIAEQVLQNSEPMPLATTEKLMRMFVLGGVIRIVYVAEVQLIFIVLIDKGCFTVVDEAGLY